MSKNATIGSVVFSMKKKIGAVSNVPRIPNAINSGRRPILSDNSPAIG
ncbi:Uncharacterised protein [Streptococcus pneumoniae]|nr:Uncharacterised protein [Streptococcus pneumoniae]CJK63869.1 Uncharacterised protein [Streptococcus pneumoniae]